MQIKNLIKELPWHPSRIWAKREFHQINKIIVHQELGESTIEEVNSYHINPGPQNHISSKGCPHLCYHFAIRKNGEIVKANELSDIVWHCKGENMTSVGVMLVGNFSGPGYDLGTSEPTKEQIMAIEQLVDFLLESLQLSPVDVFGHYHFGKPSSPGYVLQAWIDQKRMLHNNHIQATIEKSVPEIQTRLNTLGYNTGKPDGMFGIRTQSAIQRFQMDQNLLVDGIVGPQTWSKLVNLTSKS